MPTNNKHSSSAPFAEVIISSLPQWTAQSWQWDVRPPFASLMVVEDKEQTVFGLVCSIETGSWQTERTPFPYQKTEEELLRDQPHIFEFLRTTFTCITVGYLNNETISYQYAPKPPKIHAFVRQATPAEAQAFFSDDRYVTMLFGAQGETCNLDELLLALLKQRSGLGQLSEEQFKKFIDTYSLLTGNDYRRLKLFLHRAQPGISLQK